MSYLTRFAGWTKRQISDHAPVPEDEAYYGRDEGRSTSSTPTFCCRPRRHFLTCLANKGRTIKVWQEGVGVAALVVLATLVVFTILLGCSVFGGGTMYLLAATLGLFAIGALVVTAIALAGRAPPKAEDEDLSSSSSDDSDSDLDY